MRKGRLVKLPDPRRIFSRLCHQLRYALYVLDTAPVYPNLAEMHVRTVCGRPWPIRRIRDKY